MKLYCGRNKYGIWKASLDESKVSRFSGIFESDVEAIHNDKVYMIRTFYGFDYGMSSIFDVVRHSGLYHSVSAAKKNELWKERERLAKENPEKYNVTPFSIASDDCGEPFAFGDVMEGKFNSEIIGVKVI